MRESTAERCARWIVLGLLTIFTLTPLYVMLTSAAKPLRDVQGPAGPPWPRSWTCGVPSRWDGTW